MSNEEQTKKIILREAWNQRFKKKKKEFDSSVFQDLIVSIDNVNFDYSTSTTNQEASNDVENTKNLSVITDDANISICHQVSLIMI
jgi:hypothetical protein